MIREVKLCSKWTIFLIEYPTLNKARYYYAKRDNGKISIPFKAESFDWDFNNYLTDEIIIEKVCEIRRVA